MKTQRQIAYKVLTHDMQSTWAPRPFAIVYSLDKVNKPRIVGTRLCAFETEEVARYYKSKTYNTLRIFKCEVTSPKTVKFLFDQHNIKEMRRFYAIGEIAHDSAILSSEESKYYPTMLAVTSIKLLEELT